MTTTKYGAIPERAAAKSTQIYQSVMAIASNRAIEKSREYEISDLSIYSLHFSLTQTCKRGYSV